MKTGQLIALFIISITLLIVSQTIFASTGPSITLINQLESPGSYVVMNYDVQQSALTSLGNIESVGSLVSAQKQQTFGDLQGMKSFSFESKPSQYPGYVGTYLYGERDGQKLLPDFSCQNLNEKINPSAPSVTITVSISKIALNQIGCIVS